MITFPANCVSIIVSLDRYGFDPITGNVLAQDWWWLYLRIRLHYTNDAKTVALWITPPTSMSIHAGRHSVFLPLWRRRRVGWVNNEQLMSAQANLTGHKHAVLIIEQITV